MVLRRLTLHRGRFRLDVRKNTARVAGCWNGLRHLQVLKKHGDTALKNVVSGQYWW